jgi:polyisoprenoid-binding protein YceI
VISTVVLVLVASSFASAARYSLLVDAEASELTFVLDATMHKVRGELFLSSGEIRLDVDTGDVSGKIVVDATRTNTDNKKRDKKMHFSVLESERYTEIVFQPSRMEGNLVLSGHSEVTLEGTMSIHGSDHPMTMPVAVDIDGDRVRFTSEFSVPYVEWGMKNPSVFLLRVAKQVEVKIRAEGRLTLVGAARTDLSSIPQTLPVSSRVSVVKIAAVGKALLAALQTAWAERPSCVS